LIEEGQSTYRKAIECVNKFQEHVEKAHTNKIPTDKTNRPNIRRQTQEHKSSSINERYQKKTKKKKNQTLTLRIEESKYGRVVTVMQQQVLGSSSGRELEAALCHRFCLHTTPAGESTP
jgi:translation initiation factor 1 (eIF-1/SUI1)